MEKPPTREEVMFDWFLGEAKDVADSLKETAQQIVGAREDLGSAKAGLSATAEKITRELVDAHRELTKVVDQARAEQNRAAATVQSTVARAIASNQRRTVAIATGCAVAGAFIGALAASVIVPLLTH